MSRSGHSPPMRTAGPRALARLDWIATALVATLVSLPFLVNAMAPPAKEAPEADPKAYQDQGRQRDIPPSKGADTARVTDWLLIAVGALQAGLIYRQVSIGDRQAQIADTQLAFMAQIERPLILLGGVGWRDGAGWRARPDPRQFPAPVVLLANHGRGLAIIDRCQVGVVVGVTPPERRTDADGHLSALWRDDRGVNHLELYRTYYRYGATRADTEIWRLPCNSYELTPAQVREVENGHQRVWVDGVAAYRDAGSQRYETQFRYVYDPGGDFFMPDPAAPDFNRHT